MNLTVVGTGMMGCSFASAARRRDLFASITGVDANPAAAEDALQLGIVDHTAAEVPADADFVLLACPSDLVAQWVAMLADHPGVVCDVGSIKAPIVDAVRVNSGTLPPRFVPAHPVAGSHESGPGAAVPDLFDGATVVLTPGRETDRDAVEKVAALWQAVGAHTEILSPEQHDAALAITSHLPHLLAFAYVGSLPGDLSALAGGGFRDFTRIAGSDPDMWQRIFGMNQDLLLQALAEFRASLDRLEDSLRAGDTEDVLEQLERAARNKRQFDGP